MQFISITVLLFGCIAGISAQVLPNVGAGGVLGALDKATEGTPLTFIVNPIKGFVIGNDQGGPNTDEPNTDGQNTDEPNTDGPNTGESNTMGRNTGGPITGGPN